MRRYSLQHKGFKYIRKYRVGGKWRYVYADSNTHNAIKNNMQLSENARQSAWNGYKQGVTSTKKFDYAQNHTNEYMSLINRNESKTARKIQDYLNKFSKESLRKLASTQAPVQAPKYKHPVKTEQKDASKKQDYYRDVNKPQPRKEIEVTGGSKNVDRRGNGDVNQKRNEQNIVKKLADERQAEYNAQKQARAKRLADKSMREGQKKLANQKFMENEARKEKERQDEYNAQKQAQRERQDELIRQYMLELAKEARKKR